MNEYIESVLKKVFLPQSVKSGVEAALRAEFNRAANQDELEDQVAARLGDAEALAERYNESYRVSMRKQLSYLNIGVAVLVCLILLFSWLFLEHIFSYAQEQMSWYLYQTYQSGMLSGGPGAGAQQQQQQQQPGLFGGASGFNNDKVGVTGAPPVQYVFQSPLNFALIGMCGLCILMCGLGIYYIGRKKDEWRSYKLYIEPLPVLKILEE